METDCSPMELTNNTESEEDSDYRDFEEADVKDMRLEAEAVVNDVLFAVSNMFVSKTLPCAEDVAYINVETKERGRYCVELTDSGLRVNYFVYNSLTVFILNNVPVQKVPRKHLQRYQNSIHILLYFYESQFYVFPYRVALLFMQTKEEGKLVGKQAFI